MCALGLISEVSFIRGRQFKLRLIPSCLLYMMGLISKVRCRLHVLHQLCMPVKKMLNIMSDQNSATFEVGNIDVPRAGGFRKPVVIFLCSMWYS